MTIKINFANCDFVYTIITIFYQANPQLSTVAIMVLRNDSYGSEKLYIIVI